MGDRDIDWKAYVDRLAYCYGCGRFGLPRPKSSLPRHWEMLYQPHANAPSGLPVCGQICKGEVQAALRRGPVMLPLRTATELPAMPAELREQMFRSVMRFAVDTGRVDDLFKEALEEEGEIDDGSGGVKEERDE